MTARETQKDADYVLHRMCLAVDRFLSGGSTEEKSQALSWIGAWKQLHALSLQSQK